MLFTNFSEKNQAAHAFSKVESLKKSNAISKNLQISTATDNKIRAAWRSQSKGVKAKNNFLPEIPPKEPIPTSQAKSQPSRIQCLPRRISNLREAI
jgi:hypothetical protein